MFEGFTGYSLPDDLLSGTGLRIASGITLSVPVIGTWTHWALFGGEFPGTEIIPRLYIVHVLLLPGHPAGADRACTSGWSGTRSTPSSPARAAPRATSSACGSCRRSRPRAARSSPSPSACIGHAWAGCSRSTRSGTSARTTRRSLRGLAARLLHGLVATAWPGCSRPGRSCSATTRSRRCSGPPSAFLPLIFVVAAASTRAIERKFTEGQRAAQPAAAPAGRAGAHRRSASWRSRSTWCCW